MGGKGKLFLTECLLMNAEGMLELRNDQPRLKRVDVKVHLRAQYLPNLKVSPQESPSDYKGK